MANLPSAPIPTHYQRIILINPTRYLGNLLIAGGLIQHFYDFCQKRQVSLKLVFDESHKELLSAAFPSDSLIFYPRQRINKNNALGSRVKAYWHCLGEIRQFRADIAFNIEEDPVSHRLCQLSGAQFKLGCNVNRHRRGYDRVLNIQYLDRGKDDGHRWHSYYDIFKALSMDRPSTGYLKLHRDLTSDLPLDSNTRNQMQGAKKTIAIHAGATKDYKKWPLSHFSELTKLIGEHGWQVVLIGSGIADNYACKQILDGLASSNLSPQPINLCNLLSLAQLSHLLARLDGMIGNDSGPIHLAGALNLPACVIFGPTDLTLWKPLGERCQVMTGSQACAAQCTRQVCLAERRCLSSISPGSVFKRLLQLIDD